MKIPKQASQDFAHPAYRSNLAISSQWSAKSWTMRTREPILCMWLLQLRVRRARVAKWWMNISQKSCILIQSNTICMLKYLSLHVKELCKEERPVEGHLQHVVPPDSRVFKYE